MSIKEICGQARAAASVIAGLARTRKDEALERIAEAIERRRDEILRENADDIAAARGARLGDETIDRLYLDEERLADLAADVRRLTVLEDPVGSIERGGRLDGGLEIRELRAPFGVVGVIYEWHPRTTIDAAAVCVKAGNACVLRGAASGKHSNRMLAEVAEGAVLEAGLPPGTISHLSVDPEELLDLLRDPGCLDLVVPLGGDDLRKYVGTHASAPSLTSGAGNCHVYVDAAADLQEAEAIVINAKCTRAGHPTAAETLLVHGSVARAFLPGIIKELDRRGVEVYGDRTTIDLAADVTVKRATAAHYEKEFLTARIAVRVVASIDEAVAHIARFGTGSAEVIVTEDLAAARVFTERVDAACVFVNASTRLADGAAFGHGVDLGVCTQKLHLRGPIGPHTLTCSKYVVWGDGHVHQ